ncbi:MAG TPA: response regulator [bacterium]|nr:response regulator [bacterium]
MTTETRQKLILVVDDEPDVITYLTTLLEDNGYATDSAVNGTEAMAKLRQLKPDLITLDISIPEKSGVRVYREMKEDPDLAHIPVLVITAVTGYGGKPEVFEQFLSSRKHIPSPEGFIDKPLEDREGLLRKIADLLA